jgi:hypothetical protein
MRTAEIAEIAVFRDDDAAAVRLEAPRQEIVIGVAIPDDEQIVAAEAAVRDPAANV